MLRDLVEEMVKAIVDNPDDVHVNEVSGEQTTVIELRVAQSDMGKVIGKQGRTAKAMRTILNASGMKMGRRFELEIIE
ncbi:KH domain-containing protein [bacterium]|nr:KH domain-containing protein [candidate division CSSED10-310 bacterium]